MEQHINLKLFVKLGKTATESNVKISVRTRMFMANLSFEWFKRFKDERETMEDDACLGRPCMLKTDANIQNIGQ